MREALHKVRGSALRCAVDPPTSSLQVCVVTSRRESPSLTHSHPTSFLPSPSHSLSVSLSLCLSRLLSLFFSLNLFLCLNFLRTG